LAQHAGAVLGQILRARRAAMVARGRVAQGPGHVNAAFGNADLQRSRRTSQNQARLRSWSYSNKLAKRKGPDDAKAIPPAQASTGPLQPSHFEPVQSAHGEEWYDACAYQPQDCKVPDENLDVSVPCRAVPKKMRAQKPCRAVLVFPCRKTLIPCRWASGARWA
jgi:hypothetical protein